MEVGWGAIFNKLRVLIPENSKVYGVPKGGMVAASFLGRVLKKYSIEYSPENADIILDDILESGKTKEYYEERFPDIEFIALFDKQKDSTIRNSWLLMPWEVEHPAGCVLTPDTVQQNIVRLLEFVGEDPRREGLRETPDRVIRSYAELYSGYNKKAEGVLTTFNADGYDQIILLKDIEMYSTCEHHMLPFYGKAHVAYIPNEKIVGISKLARLVDIYARRLQIQERIGDQVTTAIMDLLDAKGAACVIEARHMCMCSRGVGKQNSLMTTSSLKGVFLADAAAKQELIQLIKQ